MAFLEHFQVRLVGLKFVNALNVVVAPNDLIRDPKAAKILGRQLVARCGAGIELGGVGGIVVTVLGLAQVSEGTQRDVAVGILGLLEDWEQVRPASGVIIHLARVDVQVANDADEEGRGIVGVLLVAEFVSRVGHLLGLLLLLGEGPGG